MLRPYLSIAALSTVLACVTRTVTPGSVTALSAGTVGSGGTAARTGTHAGQSLVQVALTLDAAGDARADTLYAPHALLIGNARVRVAAPRFAGIVVGAPPGQVSATVVSATVES